MNLTGKALAILMTFVLGLAVVACGSDSESDSTSTGDTAAQTADTSSGEDSGSDDAGSAGRTESKASTGN